MNILLRRVAANRSQVAKPVKPTAGAAPNARETTPKDKAEKFKAFRKKNAALSAFKEESAAIAEHNRVVAKSDAPKVTVRTGVTPASRIHDLKELKFYRGLRPVKGPDGRTYIVSGRDSSDFANLLAICGPADHNGVHMIKYLAESLEVSPTAIYAWVKGGTITKRNHTRGPFLELIKSRALMDAIRKYLE